MNEKEIRAEVFYLVNRALHARSIAEGGDAIIPDVVFEIIKEVQDSYAD